MQTLAVYVTVLADFETDELLTIQGKQIFDQLFDELTRILRLS